MNTLILGASSFVGVYTISQLLTDVNMRGDRNRQKS